MTLDLTINESYDDVVDTMYRCVGDSALLAGSYQTISGVYVDTLQSVTGCDSIVSTTLIVDTAVYSTTDLELCYGDSALFGGVMYDTSGVYRDTLQSAAGCDSIATLNLTIKDLNVGDTTILVACDSAEWNGVMYDTSGIYIDTLQSIAGCDSILTLDLTINNSLLDTLFFVQFDSVIYNNNSYTSSGIYTDSLQSSFGCDSIIILNVIISDVTYDTINICYPDSIFLAGTYQTLSGNYSDTLQTLSGQDSLLVTTLIVDTAVYSTTDLELCYGDSALFGGVMYDTSGVYRDTLQSSAGCDSIATLNLTIKDLNVGDTTILVACDSAEWNGVMYDTSGIYVDTLQSIAGCDSILTLDLTINESYDDVVDTLYRCVGDSALLAGSYQTISGVYVDTLQSVTGCDSIVSTTLIVDTAVYSTTDLELCYGDSALFGGVMYDTSGVYVDTLQSSAGCDSIATLNLTIKDLNVGDTTILVACDSAEWNGVMYDTSGIYVDTLQSIAGCDSILTLDLTINESYDDVVDTLYRCVGDSALLAGSYQTISGVYVDTLQSSAGCDSIVSTTLIVDTAVYSTTDLELCYGDSALFGGVMYDTSGVYRDTLQSSAGCDSIATLNLTIKDLNVGDTTILVACDSAEWNGVMYDTSGIYVDTLQSIAGCDSIMTLDLTINESYDDVVDTMYRCTGDSALLAGSYQTISGVYVDTLQS